MARAVSERFQALCVLFAVCCLLPALTSADVPQLVRYQGQAVDTNGVPLNGDKFQLTFRLYDAETGGAVAWDETLTSVPITKGHFAVLLGQNKPFTTVDWSKSLWISLQIGSDPELLPRQRITSVPLAIRAGAAEKLTAAITPSLITPQGSGSGLDADTVDGKHASELVAVSTPAGGDLTGTYPNPVVTKLQSLKVSSETPKPGQVLRWDGSQWTPGSVSGFSNVEVSTTNGTWVRPPSVGKVWVRVWGAGGGGGGGGGSSGGAGGGEDGGSSSFGSYVIATGGRGGVGANFNAVGNGGAPGSGSSGFLQFSGSAGAQGTRGTAPAGGQGGSGGAASGGVSAPPGQAGSTPGGAGGGAGGASGFAGGGGGGGGGYAEGIVTVSGDVSVTVGQGGRGGSAASGGGSGGSGGGGVVIISY